jgi:hypothetical protein
MSPVLLPPYACHVGCGVSLEKGKRGPHSLSRRGGWYLAHVQLPVARNEACGSRINARESGKPSHVSRENKWSSCHVCPTHSFTVVFGYLS